MVGWNVPKTSTTGFVNADISRSQFAKAIHGFCDTEDHKRICQTKTQRFMNQAGAELGQDQLRLGFGYRQA